MAKKKKRKPHKKHKPHNRKAGSYNTSGLARYRAIASAIRNNYKEQKREYSRRDINDLYHQFKDKLKDVPLDQLDNAIDGLLNPQGEFPAALDGFEWYYFEDLLHAEAAFFKPTDVIKIYLDEIGEPPIEFDYRNLTGMYRYHYNTFRPKVDEVFKYPELNYLGEKNGTFSWTLSGQRRPGAPTYAPMATGLEKEEKKPTGVATKQAETEKENYKLEIELEKEKQKTGKIEAKNRLLSLYEKDKITKKEFLKMMKDLEK